MNSNRYSELLEKYYNGDTTVEEERWLKEHTQLSEEPLPLTLLQPGDAEMNWSFGEMLEQSTRYPRTDARGKIFSKEWMKYAAAIIGLTLLSIAVFVKKEPQNATETTSTKPVIVPAIKALIKDTLSHEKNNPVVPVAIAATHPVITKKKKAAPVKAFLPAQQNDDFFVMVDGRRITNENEALAILQQSFNKISGDMQAAMSGINNSPKLDFKLK